MTTEARTKALELAIFVVEEVVKEVPALVVELVALFQQADPTLEDWQTQRNKILFQLAELEKGSPPTA